MHEKNGFRVLGKFENALLRPVKPKASNRVLTMRYQSAVLKTAVFISALALILRLQAIKGKKNDYEYYYYYSEYYSYYNYTGARSESCTEFSDERCSLGLGLCCANFTTAIFVVVVVAERNEFHLVNKNPYSCTQ